MEKFSFENLSSVKEKEHECVELKSSLDLIKKSGLISDEYLGSKSYYFFEKKPFVYSIKNNLIEKKKLNIDDVLKGRITEYIPVNTKETYEGFEVNNLDDQRFIQVYFLQDKPIYDEFIVHEAAHVIFDEKYFEIYSKYEFDEKGVPIINENFSLAIKTFLKDLFDKHQITFDLDEFPFDRQHISEIFAFLYHRELTRRLGRERSIDAELEKRVSDFFQNPKKFIKHFNQQYGRECIMDDIYRENHVLSYLVTPILEKEFPEFGDRIKFFFEQE